MEITLHKFLDNNIQKHYPFGIVPPGLVKVFLEKLFGNFDESHRFKYNKDPNLSKIVIDFDWGDDIELQDRVPAILINRGALVFSPREIMGYSREFVNQVQRGVNTIQTQILITIVGGNYSECEILASYVVGAFMYFPNITEILSLMLPYIKDLQELRIMGEVVEEHWKNINKGIVLDVNVSSLDVPMKLNPQDVNSKTIWITRVGLDMMLQNYWIATTQVVSRTIQSKDISDWDITVKEGK